MWIIRNEEVIIIIVGKETNSIVGRSVSQFAVIDIKVSINEVNGITTYIENWQMKMAKVI